MEHKKIERPTEEIVVPEIKLRIKKRVIPLKELNDLKAKEQYDSIKKTLVEIYEGKIEVDRKMVLKCVSLTCSKEDIKNYLPFGLIVEKKKEDLIFRTDKKKNTVLILLFLNILAFAMIAASYSAIDFLSKKDLNKDIDGDGIADINIDINEDDKPEINIDTNGDDKPDINIDYKGNWNSVFNIDTDEDNQADSNLVVTLEEGEVCKKDQVNCDVNGDGWPDVNLDITGDGVADMDIDSDEDGTIDLNIDNNSDGICDINCDITGDWKCDLSCISIEIVEQKPGNSTGSSSVTGNPGVGITMATTLKVIFTDSTELVAKDIYPDDQPGVSTPIPDKVFTIENQTGATQYYNLSWVVGSNTFVTDNFMFKVESTNGGGTLDWTTYPKNDHIFLGSVSIAPHVTQTYVISSKLRGINAPQNEDQGKEFIGKIHVDLVNQ